jgi:hypothetical protein
VESRKKNVTRERVLSPFFDVEVLRSCDEYSELMSKDCGWSKEEVMGII